MSAPSGVRSTLSVALSVSENPNAGVVDGDARVHYVRNLYIAGGSTFPTCGQANPMLTIVAMALRLAQHLEMKLDDRFF